MVSFNVHSVALLVILAAALVQSHPHDDVEDGDQPCVVNANCQQRVLVPDVYPLQYHWVATCHHYDNLPSGFNCSCRPGFTESNANPKTYDDDADPDTNPVTVPFLCVDVDECAGADPCTVHVSNYDCTNTFGSFECSCKTGYRANAAGACVDINECDAADPDHNCDCQASCTNTAGSFTCACNAGYQTPFDNSLRTDCHDQAGANPRAQDPNTPQNWDGTVCVNVNEPKLCPNVTGLPDLCNCGANSACFDTEGSFQCVCDTGFQTLDGTGTDCTDFVECANSKADIDWSATENTMTALCVGCRFICDGCTGDRAQGPADAAEYIHPLGRNVEECLSLCAEDDLCRAAGFEEATSDCWIQHRKGSMVMIARQEAPQRDTWLKVPTAAASAADIGRVRVDLLTTENECASQCTAVAGSNHDYTCSCGAGFVRLPSGECVQCGHASTYHFCEDDICEICPIGTATLVGGASCCRRDCLCKAGLVGSYRAAPGHVAAGADAGCYACPASSYADTTNNVCQTCPENAGANSIWSPRGSGAATDCVCVVNHFHDTSAAAGACAPPSGTEEAPCVQCPDGSTSQGGLGGIESCECAANEVKVSLPNGNFRCAARDVCTTANPCTMEGQLCRTDFTAGTSQCFCNEANNYYPFLRDSQFGVRAWQMASEACTVPDLSGDDFVASSTAADLSLDDSELRTMLTSIMPVNLHPAVADEWAHVAAKFNGRLQIRKGGDYHFCVQSSDGAILQINGNTIVSNNARSTPLEDGRVCTAAGQTLAAGEYPVEVHWFSNTGAMALHVTYSGPDTVSYYDKDGDGTSSARNWTPLPSVSSSYGVGAEGCYRNCMVRQCTVGLSNHIRDEHLDVNSISVTVDRQLAVGQSLFMAMPGWNNDDTAFTGPDINEFDFAETVTQAPRWADVQQTPQKQSYERIGCRVNGGELGTSPFCGASTNVVVASISACAQAAADSGVDGFCYNRASGGSFGGVCWITDPAPGNGLSLVDEMPTTESSECLTDSFGDGVGEAGAGSDSFSCYRLTTPPATTLAACAFEDGDVVKGFWHRAIQTLEIRAVQPVCAGTHLELTFDGEDFGLHNPSAGFSGNLALTNDVDSCDPVMCAAPKIAAPPPRAETVGVTEREIQAPSGSSALLAAGTFAAAGAVVATQSMTPVGQECFASDWFQMDVTSTDGTTQPDFQQDAQINLQVYPSRVSEYTAAKTAALDVNCNREEVVLTPHWRNDATGAWVQLASHSYDEATGIVTGTVPQAVLNRATADGRRFVVLCSTRYMPLVRPPGEVFVGCPVGGGGDGDDDDGGDVGATDDDDDGAPVVTDREMTITTGEEDDDDDGLTDGEIAGIVLGCLAAAALVGASLFAMVWSAQSEPEKTQDAKIVYATAAPPPPPPPAPVMQVEYVTEEVDVIEPTVQYQMVQPSVVQQPVQVVQQPVQQPMQVVQRVVQAPVPVQAPVQVATAAPQVQYVEMPQQAQVQGGVIGVNEIPAFVNPGPGVPGPPTLLNGGGQAQFAGGMM